MMSKQQRLYHEQNNKERVQKELIEMAKQTREIERKTTILSTSDPHKNSYYS